MRQPEMKLSDIARQNCRIYTHRKETALLKTHYLGTVNPRREDRPVYETLVYQKLLTRVRVTKQGYTSSMYQLTDKMKWVLNLLLDRPD